MGYQFQEILELSVTLFIFSSTSIIFINCIINTLLYKGAISFMIGKRWGKKLLHMVVNLFLLSPLKTMIDNLYFNESLMNFMTYLKYLSILNSMKYGLVHCVPSKFFQINKINRKIETNYKIAG